MLIHTRVWLFAKLAVVKHFESSLRYLKLNKNINLAATIITICRCSEDLYFIQKLHFLVYYLNNAFLEVVVVFFWSYSAERWLCFAFVNVTAFNLSKYFFHDKFLGMQTDFWRAKVVEKRI